MDFVERLLTFPWDEHWRKRWKKRQHHAAKLLFNPSPRLWLRLTRKYRSRLANFASVAASILLPKTAESKKSLNQKLAVINFHVSSIPASNFDRMVTSSAYDTSKVKDRRVMFIYSPAAQRKKQFFRLGNRETERDFSCDWVVSESKSNLFNKGSPSASPRSSTFTWSILLHLPLELQSARKT